MQQYFTECWKKYCNPLKFVILQKKVHIVSLCEAFGIQGYPSSLLMLRYIFLTILEWGSPQCHLSLDPLLIVSVSKVAWLLFDVQTPSSSQRRLTAGAEREADGPRQDTANLTSLSPFQVLWFNQPLPHKLLWSTFEIMASAQ